MIVNPEVRNTFRSRAFITSSIRRMLDADGFLEIETPILNSQPGGAEAKPFETYHNSLDMHLTLRIATELHLKRLVTPLAAAHSYVPPLLYTPTSPTELHLKRMVTPLASAHSYIPL